MTTFYLDPEGGNDANDGQSFANRWKTLTSGATAARIAPGDTIRVKASPDPTLVGNATWTDNSRTVTLAAAVTGDLVNCDSAWTAAANVTASASTAAAMEGGSAELVIASGFTTGKAAHYELTDLGSAPAGAHRHWRIYITSILSGSYVSIIESQMRETSGGADQTGSGTASASSTYTGEGATPAKAFDNVLTYPGWTNNADLPCWLAYDFGSGVTKEITEVTILNRNDSWWNQVPVAFEVQYSDNGTSWTTSWSVPNAGFTTTNQTRTFTKPSPVLNNLSAYQQVSFLVRSSAALASGVLELHLCSDTAGATPVHEVTIPALAADQWTPVVFDNAAALGSSINSVALYANSDPGAITINLDNIVVCKASSAADSLTHRSLIGKARNIPWVAGATYAVGDKRQPTSPNRTGFCYRVSAITTGVAGGTEPTWPRDVGMTVTDGGVTWTCDAMEETWYTIAAITGAAITIGGNANHALASSIRGYQGETETIATYKREPILDPNPVTSNSDTTAANIVQDSGTAAGGYITFTGGWNRTDMSTQTGETWLDGQTSEGAGFYATNCNYLNVQNINAVRYDNGIYFESGSALSMSHCHGVGCDDVGVRILYGAERVELLNVIGAASGTALSLNSPIKATCIQCLGGSDSSSNLGVNVGGRHSIDANYVAYKGNNNATNTGFGINSVGGNEIDYRIRNWVSKNNANAPLYAGGGGFEFHNATFGESPFYANLVASTDAQIKISKFGGVANDHRVYTHGGTIMSATDQRHTASGISWKFNPTSTTRGPTYPLRLSVGKIACVSGVSKTVTIWARRNSTNIKGKLIALGGFVAGIHETTVACEPSVNTWTSYSISISPTEDGVLELEFHVWDGVGTTNSFWIDDLSVS